MQKFIIGMLLLVSTPAFCLSDKDSYECSANNPQTKDLNNLLDAYGSQGLVSQDNAMRALFAINVVADCAGMNEVLVALLKTSVPQTDPNSAVAFGKLVQALPAGEVISKNGNCKVNAVYDRKNFVDSVEVSVTDVPNNLTLTCALDDASANKYMLDGKAIAGGLMIKNSPYSDENPHAEKVGCGIVVTRFDKINMVAVQDVKTGAPLMCSY